MSTNYAHRVHWVCIQKQQRWLGTDRTAASSRAGHTLGAHCAFRCLAAWGEEALGVALSGSADRAARPKAPLESRSPPERPHGRPGHCVGSGRQELWFLEPKKALILGGSDLCCLGSSLAPDALRELEHCAPERQARPGGRLSQACLPVALSLPKQPTAEATRVHCLLPVLLQGAHGWSLDCNVATQGHSRY